MVGCSEETYEWARPDLIKMYIMCFLWAAWGTRYPCLTIAGAAVVVLQCTRIAEVALDASTFGFGGFERDQPRPGRG